MCRRFAPLPVALAVALLATMLPVWAEDKKEEPKVELSQDEQALLELTNKERAREKLPPLKLNATLCKAARGHSANMARKKEMSHVLDGKTPKDRLRDAGYPMKSFAENIAFTEDPKVKMDGMMNSLMQSKSHRENILNAGYQEIGLGVVRIKDTVYCTQVFGTPQPRP